MAKQAYTLIDGAWVPTGGPAGAQGQQGPQGAPGPSGNIITGLTPPTSTTGQEGWYYLDTDDRVLYGPKKGSAWPIALHGRSDVLVLGPQAPVPIGTTDGTVIVRMIQGNTFELDTKVTVWNGSAPTTDTTPPAKVTALKVFTASEAGLTLTWVNPVDSDLARIIVRRAAGSTAPNNPVDGVNVALTNPKDTFVVDAGLQPSSTYSYAVFTADLAGNINLTPVLITGATTAVASLPAPPPAWANTLVLDETWATLDSARWGLQDSTYGSDGNRIQRYRPANAVVSAASLGGSGNSLKMISKRETYQGNDFTAAMIGSRDGTTPTYYPRYGRYEVRHKIPHGQGVWPAAWLRHRAGSAVCEVDFMEYFESQVPGRLSCNLHRTAVQGGGVVRDLANKSVAFEVPHVSYQATGDKFHTSTVDILPWTATTVSGGTYGNPDLPSANVLFRFMLNGIVTKEYVDTSASYWTSLYDDQAFDICLQGSQIGGTWNGHPDDPLGYSRWLTGGACVIGGTPPDNCNKSYNSVSNLAPVFPNTYEVDYIRVYEYTGSGVVPGTPVISNNAEGGVAGTFVTTANSGGASGTAFSHALANLVSYTATAPIEGDVSFEVSSGSSGASVGWINASLTAMPVLYGRMYINLPAWPTGGTGLVAVGKDADSGAYTWRIGIGTTGNMRFGITTAGFIVDATPALTLNTSYRLEWMVDSVSGMAEIRAYTMAGGLHSSATVNFTPNNPTVYAAFGRPSSGSGTFSAKFDGIALGTTGWLGA